MAKRKQSRYRKIRVSFLARESGDVESLIRLCKLVGKVESLPKNMHISNESPQTYSFVLRLRPYINRGKTEDVLLNTWPVQSIMPVR